MGKLIQLAPFRQTAGSTTAATSHVLPSEITSDADLAPIAALLFVASLARVIHAFWTREPFDTEPTLALGCVIGLPWLAWQIRRNKAANQLGERRPKTET